MTKKHFETFAREIAKNVRSPGYQEQAKRMADMVIKVASTDNPNFNRTRFLKACGL